MSNPMAEANVTIINELKKFLNTVSRADASNFFCFQRKKGYLSEKKTYGKPA
jgi:hypothetical protein